MRKNMPHLSWLTRRAYTQHLVTDFRWNRNPIILQLAPSSRIKLSAPMSVIGVLSRPILLKLSLGGHDPKATLAPHILKYVF
jgi:hypothetical protein